MLRVPDLAVGKEADRPRGYAFFEHRDSPRFDDRNPRSASGKRARLAGSNKGIEHGAAGVFEVSVVACDDREVVGECGGRDETIFDGHREAL